MAGGRKLFWEQVITGYDSGRPGRNHHHMIVMIQKGSLMLPGIRTTTHEMFSY
jgi:hypothetical protein